VFGRIAPSCAPHVARLSVLYEDLRIEIYALAEDSMPRLDATDVRYRRHYFMRRSIATLVEFAEAIRHLNDANDFDTIRESFNDEPTKIKMWNDAVEFFDKNEQFLSHIRNDIGGHFGLKAARHAVEHLHDWSVGVVRVEGEGKLIHLEFAGEIAATALGRAEPEDFEKAFARLWEITQAGYGHAVNCVHCLVVTYLWDRFG
jgi:hypothetical protein